MVYRPSKILAWLPLAVIALLFLGAFVLSDPWVRISIGMGSALIFANLAIIWREKRRAQM
jgi:hypothetical protein